jgi:hypothetical protein
MAKSGQMSKLRILLVILPVLSLSAAGDPWDKVREVKSGTELRIFKKGGKPPVLATMDEANDERIVVVIKNEQTALPKDEIDRIDFRPPGGGKARVTKESKIDNDAVNKDIRQAKPGDRPSGPSGSSGGGLSFGGKPDFQLLYRRQAGAPKK